MWNSSICRVKMPGTVGKRVEVCEYPDGGFEIRHGDHALP